MPSSFGQESPGNWFSDHPGEGRAVAVRALLREIPTLNPRIGRTAEEGALMQGGATRRISSTMSLFAAAGWCWDAVRYAAPSLEIGPLEDFRKTIFGDAEGWPDDVFSDLLFAAYHCVGMVATGRDSLDRVEQAHAAANRLGLMFTPGKMRVGYGTVQVHYEGPDQEWAAYDAAGVIADADLVDKGAKAPDLLSRPLWLNPRPHEQGYQRDWQELRAHLLSLDEGWEIWVDWYQRRLDGEDRGEDYELQFRSAAPLVEKGMRATEINAHIREEMPKS